MDSMEEIYQSHARIVYAFLLTKTQSPDLAEELTQETFYQAVKSIHTFREESSIASWLCGIARNVWLAQMRKQRDWVSLEDPMREVMYLRLIGNLTFGKIGEIMGRSENWARVTYYRGKEKIVKEANADGTENTL